MTQPRAILVTGGAGYIGSHTVKMLHRSGTVPVVLDNLLTGHRWALRYGRFIKGDLQDAKRTLRILGEVRPWAVLHFAASAEVEGSMRDPHSYFGNNVLSTLNLLAAMRAVRCRLLVFSSSAAVYGAPGRRPLSESDACRPINPYGESKLMCERMIHWCSQADDLKYVSFRYFNAAGADPDGELGEIHRPEKHLIPCILRAAAGIDRKFHLYGTRHPTRDGTCVRDFLHVSDVAQAHIRAIGYLADGGQSMEMNLGTGKGTTVREIIDLAARVTGRRIRPVEAPARRGDPPILVADCSRARKVLGFTPRYVDPEPMIRSAWDWFRNTGIRYARAGQ
ncbi:MAG: UDP-glucose 4-epimerase GalE [Nitrospirae bacterium]|nr:UDP-glucose 4-epimerase GalE [Nitrospirota bacterium]